MLNKIIKFIKKLVVTIILLYGYSKLSVPFNVNIPINAITILLVYFFGIPAIIMFLFFSMLFM